MLPGFDSGDLSVPVAATPARRRAPAAYERFAAGGKLGKIVLPRSGPSRDVPPEIGDRRSPPGGVLDHLKYQGYFLRVCVLAWRRRRPVFRVQRHEKTH